MSNVETIKYLHTGRRSNLNAGRDTRDVQSQVPPEDTDRDRSAHQLYSGTFTVTGSGGQQFIGNQYARRDLNITTGPSRQHEENECSQRSHFRQAPPPPSRIYIARALYDFDGVSSGELQFKAGDKIELTGGRSPNQEGWLTGRVIGGAGTEGFLPQSYVEILTE